MPQPQLHLLAGPNGSGKSTYVEHVLLPDTGLSFINADLIAAELWPGRESEMSYDAAQLADERRQSLLNARKSFIAETVFSHPSKVQLAMQAIQLGYFVTLHVMVVPLVLASQRVEDRVGSGGHSVPADKITARYERLWPLVVAAAGAVHEAWFYDNSAAAAPYQVLGIAHAGQVSQTGTIPEWVPEPVREFLIQPSR